MTTYIALLRGVNVGRTQLPMADLRRVLESLGHGNVQTYVQSGNAIFTSGRTDVAKLSRQIETAISSELELAVPVLLRRQDELAAAVELNPFPEAVQTPTQLHVMFTSSPISTEVQASLDETGFDPDRFEVGDRCLYLWLPNGLGRSKLPPYLSERRLGVRTTTRNWNTVTKLLALAAQPGRA